MDRISQLPDYIAHHILSFSNTLELVRASVLSKHWLDITASFPILEFSINSFTSRESFFSYVEYTMSLFYPQNVPAHKFKLNTTIEEPAELEIVNRCLELLFRNGVKVLVIDIDRSSESASASAGYRLPNILLSVSMLESLTVRGCELPSSLKLGIVKFKSLNYLELRDVRIDNEVIKYFTTSCPLLQTLQIVRCNGFNSFCVDGHQSLRNVLIFYSTRVERVDIEAPNLSTLYVIDRDGNGAPRMNLTSCKKLTTVSYIGHPLPNSNGFTDFLSNFPYVKSLFLATIYKCSNFKLSSNSLRKLVLHSNCDFEEIEFSTPNLVLFTHSRNSRLLFPTVAKRWPLVKNFTHSKACMQCYPDGCIDALWFQKLRLFLAKKSGLKVLNLYIHAAYSQKYTELEKLHAIELPPYELEHVVLQLESHEESLAHIAFVDAVLWCCRPRSLTLRSSFPFEEHSDVVKFAYEKLLQQEDPSHTKIRIEWPSSSRAQKHMMELKSLSMALPHEGETVSFIKEEAKGTPYLTF
ncbi:F-box/LRR-repeat protein At4g14103-like [Bidens hawaiensis]|uniref:F-box/LRR-repeat protein At4g14103-like n=1 Tax=Bidens hawaiensis TaxID=980011 RepID=UPI00404AD0DE